MFQLTTRHSSFSVEDENSRARALAHAVLEGRIIRIRVPPCHHTSFQDFVDDVAMGVDLYKRPPLCALPKVEERVVFAFFRIDRSSISRSRGSLLEDASIPKTLHIRESGAPINQREIHKKLVEYFGCDMRSAKNAQTPDG